MHSLNKQLKEIRISTAESPSQDRVLKSCEVDVITNFWSIQIEKNTIVYRYDVGIEVYGVNIRYEGSQKREKPFTASLIGRKTDDCLATERHKICQAVLWKALDTHRVIKDGTARVYDCASSLYTSNRIDAFDSVKTMQMSVAVGDLPKSIQNLIRHSNPSEFMVTIVPNASIPYFDISDFSNEIPKNVAETSKIVTNFLNLLTSQSARDRGLTVFGNGCVFDMSRPARDKRNGQEERDGANKSIKFIEGCPNARVRNDGDTTPALILDAKTGTFFKTQTFAECIQAFFGRNIHLDWNSIKNENERATTSNLFSKMHHYVKGLKFEPTYDKKSYTCVGLTRFPMSEVKFEYDGNQITLIDYLVRVLNVSGPFNENLPAGRALIDGDKVSDWTISRQSEDRIQKREVMFFALETIRLLPYQRVPNEKQLEKPKPIPPGIRYSQIQKLLHDLNLDAGGANNKYLKMFGVTISANPKIVTAIQREAPIIRRNEQKFVRGASCSTIVVAHDNQKSVANDCLNSLSDGCKRTGISVDKWIIEDISAYKLGTDYYETLTRLITKCSKKYKIGLIIFIDDLDNNSHDGLKLVERKFVIPFQQLTTEIVLELTQKRLTLQNVIRKINMKLGGLNYEIIPEISGRDKWISNENMLIVSYDVAHPGQVNTNECVMVPSVVGFSFNGASHKEAFVGDFHYQYPKKEQVESGILKRRMKWIIEKFVANRKRYPQMILIIRDGVSEGQYQMVLDDELNAMRTACQEVVNQKNLKNWSPKFAVVIATKRNPARFFNRLDSKISNVKPLTVIDRDITRANINEAYIVSANAFQGTANAVCYQLLRNEIGFKNMDEVEALMLALSYHHQICETPISLPEPVYQADEWAKRGNEMWNAYGQILNIPKVENQKCADFEFMTERLAYWHSPIGASRISA
ncbi:unnamed protein product [Caenorhabditis bovis]|uniref:Piwi domain-containing protein n=1 Tax=Caenorhabditis bovis TaxID=2654633 RepID=A0A8S1FCR8_9PELO|nr:unnamed protein product [Caenorhabditis bovis]